MVIYNSHDAGPLLTITVFSLSPFLFTFSFLQFLISTPPLPRVFFFLGPTTPFRAFGQQIPPLLEPYMLKREICVLALSGQDWGVGDLGIGD